MFPNNFEQNREFSLDLLANRGSQRRHELRLGFEQYDSLQLSLLQECDRMQLQKTTKYLAKTYFDTVVTTLPSIHPSNAPLYLLTSILLAVKFNENRMVSQSLAIRDLILASEGAFQQEDFVEAEVQILKLLGFKLSFASPYDMLHNCAPLLKRVSHKKYRLSQLQTIIDLAIALPALLLLPADTVFYACLLIAFLPLLPPPDQEALIRSIHNMEMVGQVRREIERSLNQLSEEGSGKQA